MPFGCSNCSPPLASVVLGNDKPFTSPPAVGCSNCTPPPALAVLGNDEPFAPPPAAMGSALPGFATVGSRGSTGAPELVMREEERVGERGKVLVSSRLCLISSSTSSSSSSPLDTASRREWSDPSATSAEGVMPLVDPPGGATPPSFLFVLISTSQSLSGSLSSSSDSPVGGVWASILTCCLVVGVVITSDDACTGRLVRPA